MAALFIALVIQAQNAEGQDEKPDIEWGTLPTAVSPDTGGSLLASCAASACVAGKASELARRNEAQRIANELRLAVLEEAKEEATRPLPAMKPIGDEPPASPAPSGGRTATFEATAYCDHGTTADGTHTAWGVIAAGPSYAFGTSMYVPGYGSAVVHDRGGAVSDGVIDLWMPTCGEAIQWGRRSVAVTIY